MTRRTPIIAGAIVVVVLVFVLGVVVFRAGRSNSTGPEGVAQPTVVLYSVTDRETAQELIDLFEAETGIRVDAKFDTEAAKAVGLVQAIRQEKAKPRCDVLWGGGAFFHAMLADDGCLEVTLLGQTVNSYKFRTGDGRHWRLSDLLNDLSDIEDLRRIKFITSFPKDMTDDLLQAVRDLPKVFRYLHVPAQSGCDEMLRRMKRLYTVAQYDEMIARIRETVPDCAVSSDFIVGFCGETEESFEKSVELVKRSRFKNSFIFKYSPRPGTKAFELYADDVPEEVKKRRNNDLLAVQSAISQVDNQAFVGQEFEVLVEGPSKAFTGDIASVSGPVQMTGRTITDRICVFEGNARLIGTYSKVKVVSASAVTMFAEVVTDRVTHGRPAAWSLPVIP